MRLPFRVVHRFRRFSSHSAFNTFSMTTQDNGAWMFLMMMMSRTVLRPPLNGRSYLRDGAVMANFSKPR
jgi:hypothetical protein